MKLLLTRWALALILGSFFVAGAAVGSSQEPEPALQEIRLPKRYYGIKKPLEECSPEDLNRADGIGITPLTRTVLYNELDMVQKFLSAGARADFKNEHGRTALHEVFNPKYIGAWSDKRPDPEIIKLLVKSGAEVDGKDNSGLSPLLWACLVTPDPEVIDTLLELGADPLAATESGLTPALAAARNPNMEIMRKIIAAGGNVMDKSVDGDTALMQAAEKNSNKDMIEFLIKAGVELEARNKYDASALYLAAGNNPHPEISRTLLEAGADPNQVVKPRKVGLTPTLAAAKNSNPQVIRLLVDFGGDLRARDIYQRDVLMIAVESSSAEPPDKLEIVRYLLESGLTPKSRSVYQATALHYAARSGLFFSSLDIFRLLLEAGADPNARDDYGRTPIMWLAPSSGGSDPRAIELISLLMEYGADINSRDSNGDTALNLAARQLAIGSIFEPLLKAGADPNLANQAGETPLMWAAKINREPEEVLPLLVQYGARLDLKSKGGSRLRDWLKLDLEEKTVYDWARQNEYADAEEVLKSLEDAK